MDAALDAHFEVVMELGHWDKRILNSLELDLEALAVLAADNEAAGLHCAAVELRSRLEWSRANHTWSNHSCGSLILSLDVGELFAN